MTSEEITAGTSVSGHDGAADARDPLVELRGVSKYFSGVIALKDLDMTVRPGEVMALLGDNGAGKSTCIKILSGVHHHDEGEFVFDGRSVRFESPREAMQHGIATVHQDVGTIPLMSLTRNFFLGNEPRKGWGPFKVFDQKYAAQVAREQMASIGIDVRDPFQLAGTLSGGERQSIAIARAAYFGAKLLILDEPTSALGVKEAGKVLHYVLKARNQGLGVIFITHNVHHAYPVADRFTILNRGRSYGTFDRQDTSREEVLSMMAGGEELEELSHELRESADSEVDSELADALAEELEQLPTSGDAAPDGHGGDDGHGGPRSGSRDDRA
ncbi:sugar ABC transporter ATP-binding protein [Egibacter rhizosphaerae]|uniref:Sugar ABC transporter ATP-binding protein n=1 Tax=Egibacter rhizosphaerae TaxID=1670831 RepID=A0A411YE69_9ACTN|nr:ATP-binding cassette domain-containing protein [Egibacter rhizosphaerae]QBI19498.1 sugar ABC transporter ATP-binding protein [Egibacter rhizosphaerae]